MVPGNTRELANWLIPAWKSKVVSAQNLLFTPLVSSKTGRLKAQFEKKIFPASLGSTIIVNGVGLLNFVMFVCGYGSVTFRK